MLFILCTFLGLLGVVNNAGVTHLGEIECTPMNQFEKIAQINMLGMVRVTRACLPLLRDTQGILLARTHAHICNFNTRFSVSSMHVCGEISVSILSMRGNCKCVAWSGVPVSAVYYLYRIQHRT